MTTKQKYAVDSWFQDNGQPPFVVPLSTWKWGWTPGDEIPEAEKDNPARSAGSR